MSDKPRSGADILAEIQDAPDRVAVAHICMRPDLIDAWETENDRLMELKAADSGNKRLGTGGVSAATKEQAEKVRAIEEQIEASDVAFSFHKIDKSRHSEICDEHPPRDGNMQDLMVGYNRDAVDNAVVHECLIDPVFDLCGKKACKHTNCGTWEALLKRIGPGEWQEMVQVVQGVNGAVTANPKSVLASRILDRPASGSRRRAHPE